MKRAIGSTCSRSPARQKKRQRRSKPSGGSFESSSATWGRPESGRKLVNAPSAFSTASRASCRGGQRGRSGPSVRRGGLELEAARRARRPERGEGSRRRRRPCESGFSNGISFQPSTIRSEDAPMPSAKRPPAASARAAACWASSARPRSGTPTTPVPSRISFGPLCAEGERGEAVRPAGLARPDVREPGRLGALDVRRGSSASGVIGSGSVNPQRLTAATLSVLTRNRAARARNGIGSRAMAKEREPEKLSRGEIIGIVARPDPRREPLHRVVLARDRRASAATSPTTGSAGSARTAVRASTPSRSCAGS